MLAHSVPTPGSEGVRTPFATSSVCFPLEIAQNRSKIAQHFSKFAQNRLLATARKPHMFLIVCQQHAWKVLAQCANSRVRASVGTSSVLTLDMSVPTLERKPCCRRHSYDSFWWQHVQRRPSCGLSTVSMTARVSMTAVRWKNRSLGEPAQPLTIITETT